MVFRDLTGEKFGRLLVLGIDHRRKISDRMSYYYKCLCDCGVFKVVCGRNLSNDNTKSCGCWNLEQINNRNLKHGNSYRNNVSVEYNSWAHAKSRCTSKTDGAYKNYGGRGITMCDQWLNDFNQFLKDMGQCPEGFSIDRIDNNLGYSPENCRWATSKEQQNNRRSNLILEYNGEKRNLCEWANILGIPRQTIKSRLYRGWDAHKSLETPIVRNKNVTK